METKIKVHVKNVVNNREYGTIFDSQEEANSWVEKQKKKQNWGKNEHEVICDEKVAPNSRAIYVEDRSLTSDLPQEGYEPVLDDEDESVILYYEKLQHVYKIPCEYEVTIEEYVDASANMNLRDKILSKTDWLFVSDTPIPSAHRLYYKNYRQHLRTLDVNAVPSIESFENYLKRTAPNEFLDGGEAEQIIKKFNYYL